MTLPDTALDEIEARANAATPAPWEADKYSLYIWGRDSAMVADSRLDEAHLEVKHDPIIRARGVGGKLPIDENMRFIAHARTDIPILTAEVRRLRAELFSARADMRERAAKVAETTWGASVAMNKTVALSIRALPLFPEGEKT